MDEQKEEKPSTGELAKKILETFPYLMHKLGRGLHPRNRAMGLNKNQFRTLLLVHYHGSSCMGEISRHVDLEKGSFTSVVDSLLDMGLIIRERDQKDRRRIILSVTIEGLELIRKTEGMAYRELEKKLSVLTDEDRQRFFRAVNDLYALLEKMA